MKIGFIGQNDLHGLEADCRLAAEHGFSGLEFNYWGNFRELTVETVASMRAILGEYGIECSSFGIWGWNHISPDASERAESARQLARAIEFAQALDARIFITGGGNYDDELEHNVAEFAQVMRPALDRIAAAGMRTALYGFHGGFLRDIDAFARLWEAVPDAGLKFDPANVLHAGQDYLDVLRRYGHKIVHMHIKEHIYHGGELVLEPAAGMGDLHWGKVMAYLHEHDYRGYLTIEPHGARWGQGELRRKTLIIAQRTLNQFIV